MKLTADQIETVAQALRLAADKYHANAHELRHNTRVPRRIDLALTFEAQRDAASALAEAISNAESVDVVLGEILRTAEVAS